MSVKDVFIIHIARLWDEYRDLLSQHTYHRKVGAYQGNELLEAENKVKDALRAYREAVEKVRMMP